MKLIAFIFLLNGFWIYEINQDVNLRKGPNNKKKVLTTVAEGETITVLEKTNEWWWKVEYNNKVGFIASSFISRSFHKSIFRFSKGRPYLTISVLLIFGFLVLRIKKRTLSKKKRR
ncbi:MAG: SH3 domain-containing protein [Ekhidna sp.]|nr:SH3 domain-containing protein [Ekhidna sp.]